MEGIGVRKLEIFFLEKTEELRKTSEKQQNCQARNHRGTNFNKNYQNCQSED